LTRVPPSQLLFFIKYVPRGVRFTLISGQLRLFHIYPENMVNSKKRISRKTPLDGNALDPVILQLEQG
jgi:hypothetical protein